MVEHTPGPWIPSIHGYNVVTGDSTFSICAVHDIHASRANEIGHEAARLELRANSRLIAAAPDLLAACEAIVDAFVKGDIVFKHGRQADSDPYHPANTLLCAAIAKARGE